jgi:hypothetical protein
VKKTPISQPEPATNGLELQLRTQRRTVDFDTFDIHMQQLLSMVKTRQIKVSPAYQRKFRWNDKGCSQFIESILLGIPIPSLFMATNADSTWEVVDGVQRLSTIVKFAGDESLRKEHGIDGQLVLTDLQKLSDFNGLSLDRFPENLKLHFWTRPAKVITLNDKSDMVVRYDLFERLNTGGVALSDQEIRDCVYQGSFANQLEAWSKDPYFQSALKLTPLQQRDATAEECVLRFFAFLARYKQFDHSVKGFLNEYMDSASKNFDYVEGGKIFAKTFKEIARVFPDGIRRPGKKSTTSLIFYEGIAVGAALALQKTNKLHASDRDVWMNSPELRKFTTGATNDRTAVVGRIEFCRDRFLGKRYVPDSTT